MNKILKIFLWMAGVGVLIIVILGLRMYAVYQSPPMIRVENKSHQELNRFTLEGSGFREEIGTLPAGSSRTVFVHPTGESGLQVSFRVDSERYAEDDLAYIESKGGYFVLIEIDKSFNVQVSSDFFKVFNRPVP